MAELNELLRHALELAKAQASVREMSPEAIQTFTLNMIKHLRDATDPNVTAEPHFVCDPKTAIKERSVTCVLCGKSMKSLTQTHMNSHGLTLDEYREMCGYKKGLPLVCKEIIRGRRKRMQDMRLWERRGISKGAGDGADTSEAQS